IARYYTKNNIRGGMGIVFTLAVLFVGLGIAGGVITPFEYYVKHQVEHGPPGRMGGPVPQRNVPLDPADKRALMELAIREVGHPIARWAVDDEVQPDFLLPPRPPSLSPPSPPPPIP